MEFGQSAVAAVGVGRKQVQLNLGGPAGQGTDERSPQQAQGYNGLKNAAHSFLGSSPQQAAQQEYRQKHGIYTINQGSTGAANTGIISSSAEDYNFSGVPLPVSSSTGTQNNHSHENGSIAAPKTYLGTSSGLGYLSGTAGGASTTTSTLINQAGKSTLQIRKPNNAAGVVSDYQAQGGAGNFGSDDNSQSPIRLGVHQNALYNDIFEIDKSYRDNSADARIGTFGGGMSAVRPHLVSSSGHNHNSSSNDYAYGGSSNMSPAPAAGHQKNFFTGGQSSKGPQIGSMATHASSLLKNNQQNMYLFQQSILENGLSAGRLNPPPTSTNAKGGATIQAKRIFQDSYNMFSSPQIDRNKLMKLPENIREQQSAVSPLSLIQPVSIEKVMPTSGSQAHQEKGALVQSGNVNSHTFKAAPGSNPLLPRGEDVNSKTLSFNQMQAQKIVLGDGAGNSSERFHHLIPQPQLVNIPDRSSFANQELDMFLREEFQLGGSSGGTQEISTLGVNSKRSSIS